MGGSFYLGWLNPRETSLAIWGLKGKGLRSLGKFSLSQITAKKIVKMKKYHRISTCLRDKTTITLVYAVVVITSLIKDYQHSMYMSINSSKY
jgi:hypothetical protein